MVSIVPAGWESAVPGMVDQQEKARSERYVRLARELSHKPTGPLVIRGARLFVAESATTQPGMTVVMTGRRISAVGKDGQVKVPAGATVIDAAGKTSLPGLWDMHVHIGAGDDGLLHIAAGVTNARDMGNDTISVLELRQKFADGTLIGPRLMLAGLINGSGPYQVPTGLLADDEASVRRDVDWYAAHGYEQIKVYSSMKPGLVPALIAEAHAKGLRVSGHVPAYMTASQVVKLGFDEVQHANMLLLNFMDTVKDAYANDGALQGGGRRWEGSRSAVAAGPRVREALQGSRCGHRSDTHDVRGDVHRPSGAARSESGTDCGSHASAGAAQLLCGRSARARRHGPTLSRLVRRMQGIVKAMYDAGVPIVAGTDNGPVGFQLLRELELYVQTGIPAPQVLRIATLGAATVMHHEKDRGSIAVGKVAECGARGRRSHGEHQRRAKNGAGGQGRRALRPEGDLREGGSAAVGMRPRASTADGAHLFVTPEMLSTFPCTSSNSGGAECSTNAGRRVFSTV